MAVASAEFLKLSDVINSGQSPASDASKRATAAAPVKPPTPAAGDALRQVVVLLSSTSPHRHEKARQQTCLRLLAALGVPHVAVDGADAAARLVREDLMCISARMDYPQLFLRMATEGDESEDSVVYWGNAETLQRAVEAGSIRAGGFNAPLFCHGLAGSLTGDDCEDTGGLGHYNQISCDEDDHFHTPEKKLETVFDVETRECFRRESVPFVAASNNPIESSIRAVPQVTSEQPPSSSSTTNAVDPSAVQERSQRNALDTSQQKPNKTEDSGSTTNTTDIVIYGATSFVAQHVLQYLLQASLHLSRPLRLTLAGRSASKLQEFHARWSRRMELLLASTTARPQTAVGRCIFDMFIADSTDDTTLRTMCVRTHVVLCCAGPFRRYASGVVKACAETGADYVDITGEVAWVGDMRQAYGGLARASGSRLVSLCGFDSVPSDLAVLACVEALRAANEKKLEDKNCKKNERIEISKATVWHYCVGMANGGTIHTILDLPVSLKAFLHPVPYLMDDPLVLVSPEKRKDATMEAIRTRLALDEWRNQLWKFETIFGLGVSIPFFMAIANAKVVHASAVALNYGPSFSYQERWLPVGFAFTTRLGILSIIPAAIVSLLIAFAFILLKVPLIGSRIAHRLFPPGTGMTDEACRGGVAQVYAVAETASNINGNGCNDRSSCYMQFFGDPGNWVTAQCVAESALCLLLDKEKLPPKSNDGFGTPAELLGRVLLERLRHSPVRPVTIVTKVRRNVSGKDRAMY